jgi:oligo-1,6-glucosidase
MKRWWKEAVVYQIYPRSFADSNGDGIGDIPGILSRLDHLSDLGVDVVWLSPVYRSPNDDNGYDISDYRDIAPEFGTLEDWERLVGALHARGIRLVMDLVVNHTSDEHPWFVESRKSRDNPYRDYYIWRPPREGGEPNNWASLFGGSAWAFDDATGEYYLHLFSRKQPDLNWENPAVRREVHDMMRWWLDRGVDGFRMDVITLISKAEGLPDAAVTSDRPWQWGGAHFVHGPRLKEYLLEMHREVLSRHDIMTVGEALMATTEHAVELTEGDSGPLNMLFQFEHVDLEGRRHGATSKWHTHPWHLTDLKEVMSRWQDHLTDRGWNSLYLSNHDQPRAVSRFADDGLHRVASAKMLATFLHMLQGTPYVYQGEELGMTNVRFGSIHDYRDIETLNMYAEFVGERGMDPADVLEILHAKSRDNARTPMQWTAGPNAGFTTGEPWLKVNPNHTEINAEDQRRDPDSVLSHYRRLIRLRREHPVIVYGRYRLILADHEEIYAFTRTLGEERLLVVLNFFAGTPVFDATAEVAADGAELLIANMPVDPDERALQFVMRPYEARVYRLLD